MLILTFDASQISTVCFAIKLPAVWTSLVFSRSTMPTSPHCAGIIQRGMSTLICVFFVRRVYYNDMAWDVLGHLSHILSATAIPAGTVDTCSEKRTGDNCIVQPIKNSAASRGRASFPFYILPAKLRVVLRLPPQPCCPTRRCSLFSRS